MDQPTAIAENIRQEYLRDLRLDGSSRNFVAELDRRLNQIYDDAVERYYQAPPWDLPGVQLAICCYLAWGEISICRYLYAASCAAWISIGLACACCSRNRFMRKWYITKCFVRRRSKWAASIR